MIYLSSYGFQDSPFIFVFWKIVYNLLGGFWTSWMCLFLSFIKFGDCCRPFLEILFLHLSVSSPSETPMMHMLIHLMVPFVILASVYLSSLFFFHVCSNWKLSINLSPSYSFFLLFVQSAITTPEWIFIIVIVVFNFTIFVWFLFIIFISLFLIFSVWWEIILFISFKFLPMVFCNLSSWLKVFV